MYLQTLVTAVLSTTSSDGKPSAAVIYYLVDQNLNFYFVSKSDTTKAKNLEQNNYAALTILEPGSSRTVQAAGTVEEIERPELHKELMTKISDINADDKTSWPPPVQTLQQH